MRGELSHALVVLGDNVGLRGHLLLRLRRSLLLLGLLLLGRLGLERLRHLLRRKGLSGDEAAARSVARDGAVAALRTKRHRRLHRHAHRDPPSAPCHRLTTTTKTRKRKRKKKAVSQSVKEMSGAYLTRRKHHCCGQDTEGTWRAGKKHKPRHTRTHIWVCTVSEWLALSSPCAICFPHPCLAHPKELKSTRKGKKMGDG